MGNNYQTTSIIPPGRKKMAQAFPTTDIIPEPKAVKRQLGGFAPTSIIPDTEVRESVIAADYRVVLSDNKGFEEVILENASTRGEAYAAFQAWMLEFKSDPLARPYPPDTWVICTRNGELSWKTNPFIG
jgi:hypothetical protein